MQSISSTNCRRGTVRELLAFIRLSSASTADTRPSTNSAALASDSSMQILLHRQACGRLTNVRYLRSGPVSPRSSSTRLRSPRAVQDLDRQSLTSAPRGTILKALLGGLILTAGFASSKRARPVMAAAGSDIEKVLENPKWPAEPPYKAEDFQRFDESPDTFFYSQPRFVTHIDDGAIGALREFYQENLPASGDQSKAVLDLCSSWISHYPENYKVGRVSGLGMNVAELKKNMVLTDFEVQDLNVNPKLPYEDETFDVITNAVSVDYLSKPIEMFREMHRVLKPGGMAVMSFSNRCFPTKAIAIWTSTGDPDHIWLVGSYYHYSVPGGWTEPKAKDISPRKGIFGGGDPMYVVYAHKKSA